MERIPNRRERKEMAKQAGYNKKKKNMSESQKAEMRRRSIEVGKEIHRLNTERMLREQEAAQEMREARMVQSRIEWLIANKGMSSEEAQALALSEHLKRQAE